MKYQLDYYKDIKKSMLKITDDRYYNFVID
jgi:hypothetical protein